MRWRILIVLAGFVLAACSKPEEVKKPEIKDQAREQAAEEIGVPEQSTPQRGFDALKDIKEIRNEEHARQEAEKEITDTIENQE